MLDFIFAVSHADHWHSMNMDQNPSHYPLTARLAGSDLVSRFQNISPGVWFNAYIPVNGVVSSSRQSQPFRNLTAIPLDDQVRRNEYRHLNVGPPHVEDALSLWPHA